MFLEMDGFRVSQSPRPDVVLELAREETVDAFVIDCHLAGFDGLDLVELSAKLSEKLSDRAG
jgi:DNA-binding response OmpR family regulator